MIIKDKVLEETEPIKWVVFKDKIWVEPFHCFCCGKEVSIEQFCFGRTCGYCDCGRCQSIVDKGGRRVEHDGKIIGYYEKGHGRKDIFENRGILIKPFKQEGKKEFMIKIEENYKYKKPELKTFLIRIIEPEWEDLKNEVNKK